MLRTRVITAVLLAPLAVSAIFLLNTQWMALLLGVVFTLAAWEWGRLIWPQTVARWAIPLLAAVAMLTLWYYPQATTSLLYLAVAWWLISLLWLINPEFGHRSGLGIGLFKTLIALICTAAVWSAMVQLHGIHPFWLFATLLLAWAADIAAYFVGRAYGRRKLAPKVSPGKTWAGAIGGVLGAVIVGVGMSVMFDLPVPVWLVALACAGFAAISIIGDLFASLMKRHAGAKDSSHLIPGHGGVLDRMDSLIAMVPVLVVLRWWLL
ncbi:MAG: phosphatidate cytidylyltransferase [Lysobacteraceae bacterium]|nr:MAG: phosphatidate cytidylyltransferase [Xanthomonadaceae bacterium]